MATNDPAPLFLSDDAEPPEQPGLEPWDTAVIAPPLLKAGILVVAAAAISFALLWVGNPLMLFANATASLLATSAPQDGSDHPTPTMQATASAPDLPATTREAAREAGREAPTREEIAAAFKTAGQTEAQAAEAQAEIPQAPAEPLLNQFQAWAAEQDAHSEVQPIQPTQDVQAQPAQEAQQQTVEDDRSQIRPVPKHRQLRRVQNARAEIRTEQNLRALRRKQIARVQAVEDARARERPLQNVEAPSLLHSLGLRN